MERVVLNTNFRSLRPLVEWTNEKFAGLFPDIEDETLGAVRFSGASAFDCSGGEPPVTVHCFDGRQDAAEAETVVELVRQTRRQDPAGTIAVLVRSRNHLVAIVDALKKANMKYQAQDVDPLTGRPAVQDLLSLVRALQHPADRVAWLAVLRAPWCGLTLNDLAGLCDGDARNTVWQMLNRPIGQVEMFDPVSADGRARIKRIMPILERALNNRGSISLRRLVESTWLALGGPACVAEADLLDIRQALDLLEEAGEELVVDDLERKLERLFAAPDPQAGPELQLMTIHKAKGLEFDTVILPGLGRGIRSRERTLLRWLEHPDYELLLAPIPPYASEAQEPTYRAIGEILKEKDDLEVLRLLYVAVTRAKSRLHLLGHVKPDRENERVPLSGSLLSAAWAVFGEDFAACAVSAGEEEPVAVLPRQHRRLPTTWQPPQFASTPAAADASPEHASLGSHYQEKTIKSRRTEEGRAIGTIIHFWLERIANDGLGLWSADAIREHSGRFMHQLSMHGVPQARLQDCAATVETCLINTLGCDRGRWLLTDHPEAYSELAINGLIDGKLLRATIDRTFIDETGLRWVVDYKTGSPRQDDQSQDTFLLEEKKRYQDQLRVYLELLKRLYPEQEAKAALYFPMISGWVVVDT
jgi:ATP-dependent exoDNAse (exonuclease V) beta subunit